MFTIACCLVVGLALGMVRIRLSVRLARCYAHVFVRLSVVIATDRKLGACTGCNRVLNRAPNNRGTTYRRAGCSDFCDNVYTSVRRVDPGKCLADNVYNCRRPG